MHTVKLPYGLKEGELYHVKAVARGDACGCVCPKCEGALRAAKGQQYMEHFKHVDASECEGAAEFALREKLMQLFKQSGEIILPESLLKIEGESRILIEREEVEIESVTAADSKDPLMPRFSIRTRNSHDGERTIIAIVNLGKRDPELEEFTEPIVEINLASLGDDFSVDRLIQAVIIDTRCITWASRPRAKEREAQIREELRVIHTTEADKNRLLNLAQRREPSSFVGNMHSGSSDFFGTESRKYDRLESSPSDLAMKFSNIDFTCDECGETGLTHNDMQRFKPDYGTGVCYNCKGLKRERG